MAVHWEEKSRMADLSDSSGKIKISAMYIYIYIYIHNTQREKEGGERERCTHISLTIKEKVMNMMTDSGVVVYGRKEKGRMMYYYMISKNNNKKIYF